MLGGIALQKTPSGWEFVSEIALEQFIWANLQPLFGFTPLKRQYACGGEICDILAADDQNQLVILELKNVEDRYLIQQLTRYHANLLEEKPFSQAVDYSRSPRLIAIAPSYHRHNLIDREYSLLDFQLLQFSVVRDEEGFHLLLQGLESEFLLKKYPIPFEPLETSAAEGIPDPPEQLIKWLGGCTKAEQEGFLRLRSKLLACHRRMKEIVDRRVIQYGSGKTKLCAEICFQQKSQKPILFLWLPTPSTYRRRNYRQPLVGRLRIWTNGQTISHVGHVPEGFGNMKTHLEWEQIPKEKRPHMIEGFSRKSRTPVEVEIYLGCQNAQEQPDFWEALSDLAIEKWLEKVSKTS
jgi:RecB family endonuclease NucS